MVCPVRGGSVKSVRCLGREQYLLSWVSATDPFLSTIYRSPDCHRGSTWSLLLSSAGTIWLAKCAPFLVPRPVNWTFGLPSKHLPAAPAARQAGSALVILTVLSVGAPPLALAISYGNSSSHPTLARPAGPE
jgi:hypothetical protein